jgi:hypothetical protein
MESSQMSLPGSKVYATYLFKNKFKASNTLYKKSFFVSLPKNLALTQQQVDSM